MIKVLVNGEWVEGHPAENETYRDYNSGGYHEQSWSPKIIPTKSDVEREWRDRELQRTDEFVKLPDYPVNLLPYRSELRNYPEQADFPNGTRPTI